MKYLKLILIIVCISVCGCQNQKNESKAVTEIEKRETKSEKDVEKEIENLKYSNHRSDFKTDVIFANFRSVSAGNIKAGILYRSASPCDNQKGRASTADSLAENVGINYIVNLSDSEENLEYYITEEDFQSPYFKELYEHHKVLPLHMKVNYKRNGYAKKVVKAIRALEQNNGPFLIHCVEGKERTGFVCMVVEALCDAGYEELVQDYMISYDNYYGINANTNPLLYEGIVEKNINEMIRQMCGLKKGTDLWKVDFKQAAEQYLLDGGMNQKEIENVREKLQ